MLGSAFYKRTYNKILYIMTVNCVKISRNPTWNENCEFFWGSFYEYQPARHILL